MWVFWGSSSVPSCSPLGIWNVPGVQGAQHCVRYSRCRRRKHNRCAPVFQLLQSSVTRVPLCVTEAWTRHRERQREATAGRFGQEQIRGEAWAGTVYFGSPRTKSEGCDNAVDRQAGPDLGALRELDLSLVAPVS